MQKGASLQDASGNGACGAWPDPAVTQNHNDSVDWCVVKGWCGQMRASKKSDLHDAHAEGSPTSMEERECYSYSGRPQEASTSITGCSKPYDNVNTEEVRREHHVRQRSRGKA